MVAWRNGAAMRLADVAEVIDGVENIDTLGLFNGEPAVIVLVTLQPGANVIETVDGVRALLPELQAQLPQDIELQVASDRTHSIRASLHEIEMTLMISIAAGGAGGQRCSCAALRATIIPAVATVVSLLGTFGVMYLLGFSLNNLSLMALTVATGFVVDDAIVVLENTSRHIEAGMDRFKAALLRRARGRLHRAVDQPVAGGGVHPAAVHGRPGGPAVPRVRGHAVGGGADLAGDLADHHADDVRLAAARRTRTRRKPGRAARAGSSAASTGVHARLRAQPRLGAGQRAGWCC